MGPVDSKMNQDHAHEEEPKNLQIGVGIKNLRKVFKVISLYVSVIKFGFWMF